MGSVTPSAISTLYVSGSSYITGNQFVGGTISTNQHVYLNSVNAKLGVGLGSAESSIQTANLKVTTPTTMGIHLGMDSVTGAAGIEICLIYQIILQL